MIPRQVNEPYQWAHDIFDCLPDIDDINEQVNNSIDSILNKISRFGYIECQELGESFHRPKHKTIDKRLTHWNYYTIKNEHIPKLKPRLSKIDKTKNRLMKMGMSAEIINKFLEETK